MKNEEKQINEFLDNYKEINAKMDEGNESYKLIPIPKQLKGTVVAGFQQTTDLDDHLGFVYPVFSLKITFAKSLHLGKYMQSLIRDMVRSNIPIWLIKFSCGNAIQFYFNYETGKVEFENLTITLPDNINF